MRADKADRVPGDHAPATPGPASLYACSNGESDIPVRPTDELRQSLLKLLRHAGDSFGKIRECGMPRIDVSESYPPGAAGQAPVDIESRRAPGRLLLELNR